MNIQEIKELAESNDVEDRKNFLSIGFFKLSDEDKNIYNAHKIKATIEKRFYPPLRENYALNYPEGFQRPLRIDFEPQRPLHVEGFFVVEPKDDNDNTYLVAHVYDHHHNELPGKKSLGFNKRSPLLSRELNPFIDVFLEVIKGYNEKLDATKTTGCK